MKISEFSRVYNVSYDTIRYYMKLNLIIPEKRGGYYDFNQGCQEDMEEILKLKKMNFPLDEIKNIFNFKRIGKLTPYQQNNYYQNLYKNKIHDINNSITDLSIAKDCLEEEISALISKQNRSTMSIGIDLNALSIFCCPRCKHDLLLTANRVEENQIIEGSLSCHCGESLEIKEGILYAHKSNQKSDINEDYIEDKSFHIEEYIKSTNPDFLDGLFHNLEWMQRQLDFDGMSGKVILEPGSGYGFFLRQIYDRIPDDTIYICVDNNPHLNKYLKDLLEMTGKRVKIIFICAELPLLPLKSNRVDLLIDSTGSSCYSFENREFLLELLEPYLKNKGALLGTYIIYDRYGPNNIVAESHRKYFNYNNIRDKLIELKFNLIKENRSTSKRIEKSMGEYESFAQPGDHIYYYQVKGERWS